MVRSTKEVQHPLWKVWKRRRYVVSAMGFCGFFNAYVLRVNLSIAIVAMTESTNIILENGTTIIQHPDFDWSQELQGHIISAFFYGYISTQIVGGVLATRIGGKVLFGLGVAVTAALTLITPLVVVTNVYWFIAIRVFEGICEGVTYPCIHAIWSKWAPPLERSRLATIAFSGCFVGTVVGMPASAYLASSLGWESVFYICGASGVIWFVIWTIFISGSPEDDPRISLGELKYIQESIKKVSDDHIYSSKVPWKAISTSMPVWAIIMSHFSENWGFYTLLTQLPKYLKQVYDYELEKSGFLSALPYLLMSILIQFSGQWADWLLVKRYLTTVQVRKIFNCAGFLSQTIFMVIAALWSDPIGSVGCLTFAVGLGALAWPGFSVNHLDLAPQHASILMGISNTFATIPGIISPTITGYIVKSPVTNQQWQTVFFIAAAIYLFGAIFYGTFAAGELQPWAVMQDSLKNTSDNKDQRRDNIGYIEERAGKDQRQGIILILYKSEEYQEMYSVSQICPHVLEKTREDEKILDIVFT
ncbi:sialin-like [Euwallacea similis]|uniref:sialin-like n=1 Tax=Euwallacea similis TaxID=1736056 RepID=UPI00344BF181